MKQMSKHAFDKSYYYGRVYSNYDDFIDFARIADDLYKRHKFKSFLDIGCGCGNLPFAMRGILYREFKKECDVQGVDISEFAVAKAASPFINIADCRDLSMFENRRFEMVHILGTFSYLLTLKDVKQAMEEAYRVAKAYISFDDVYEVPKETHDDYDPHRTRVHNQEQWIDMWHEVIGKKDDIEFFADEILIRKHK